MNTSQRPTKSRDSLDILQLILCQIWGRTPIHLLRNGEVVQPNMCRLKPLDLYIWLHSTVQIGEDIPLDLELSSDQIPQKTSPEQGSGRLPKDMFQQGDAQRLSTIPITAYFANPLAGHFSITTRTATTATTTAITTTRCTTTATMITTVTTGL